MNRPHQVWLLFALFLALAAGGLGWLTRQSLELDRAEAVARQQAEQEERIGLALWRMDALLMPLLVQEASRPEFTYAANYVVPGVTSGKSQQPPLSLSPLLESPPDFVILHFQLAADGTVSSPQAPQGAARDWSVQQGVPATRMDLAARRLDELKGHLSFDRLLAQLPELPPMSLVVGDLAATNELANRANPVQNAIVESFAQQQLARLPTSDDSQGQAKPRGTNGSQAENFEVSQLPTQQLQSNEINNAGAGRRAQQQLRNANTDLNSRNSVFQAYANRASNDNQQKLNYAPALTSLAVEGVSRALWIGNDLLLARRVERGGTTYIQGCWLDWPALSARLRQEVSDVLENVELRPAVVGDVARSLATLPVQVVVPVEPDAVASSSPIRFALALAWLGLTVAAVAAGVTLYSVIALSERRAAFVAAVTHELRTPLTTFRMYAEMLARGMVPSDSQPTYLETLRVESDRLAHLVDNVLQYARLERGRNCAPRETTTVASLVDRFASRLAARADQAGLDLQIQVPADAAPVQLAIDAPALEQIVFNLIDNACKYAAHGTDRRLHLELERTSDHLTWRVRDHGPGIPEAARRRLFKPFSKSVQEAAVSAPGVGLGLALSRRLAGELGGQLRLESSTGEGTVFALTLPLPAANDAASAERVPRDEPP